MHDGRTRSGAGAGSSDFRFCPYCRAAMHPAEPDGRPRCPQCGFVHYLNPVAVVAVILLAGAERLPAPDEWIPPPAATHLVCVRRAATYAGSWCLPCGYVDYDEEIRAAGEREMLEETGLEVTAEEVFAVHSNFHDQTQQTVGVWFLGRYRSGEMRPGDDADRAQLFPLHSPPQSLAFPTDRQVIARLQTLAGARRS